MTRPLDLTGVQPWLNAVTAKYGHLIEDIVLTGSRSDGSARPDSDWDVVISIRDDVYADEDAAVVIEQKIVTDESLPRPERWLDQFIIRPNGALVRWEGPVDDGDEWVKEGLWGDNWSIVNGFIEGPCGDFSRFFKEWPDPPVIWARPRPAVGHATKEEQDMTDAAITWHGDRAELWAANYGGVAVDNWEDIMTGTGIRTAAADIDTAYFHSVERFDGQPDPDRGDCAATKIWVDPCSIGGGLDVTLTVDRTNIRVDMSAGEARKLASLLYIAADAAEG
jgi:predicted nucleotidyltransferase